MSVRFTTTIRELWSWCTESRSSVECRIVSSFTLSQELPINVHSLEASLFTIILGQDIFLGRDANPPSVRRDEHMLLLYQPIFYVVINYWPKKFSNEDMNFVLGHNHRTHRGIRVCNSLTTKKYCSIWISLFVLPNNAFVQWKLQNFIWD